MSTPRRVPTAAVLASTLLALSVKLAIAAENAPRRAAPPVFSSSAGDAFVDDFRELLEGPRPSGTAPSNSASSRPLRDAAQFPWSRLIDAESLTTEIKRIANGLPVHLSSSIAFRAGGRRACRRDFALLAVLFGVVDEYDGEIRFRDDARKLRDALARA